MLDFFHFLKGAELSKEVVVRYKAVLQQAYKPASVNAKIAAINGFFSYIGKGHLKVRQLKIQRQAFCPKERELSKVEYLRLIRAAESRHNKKLSLLLQTLDVYKRQVHRHTHLDLVQQVHREGSK